MNLTDTEKAKLLKVSIRRLEPLGHIHRYTNFSQADNHLKNKCHSMEANICCSYSFEITWEKGYSYSGELVIDNSMESRDTIIQDTVNLSLANNLLLYILSPQRDDLRKMILRLQWQMERLMQDRQKTEMALDIIQHCEGIDTESILSGYEMLHDMVDSVDMFLPLLKKVFPNAQQKLDNIRMLKNRSTAYIDEAIKQFQGFSTDVLSAALNNEQELFDKSWSKLIDFCVVIFNEQKYADERLTTIGRAIYYLGKADIILVRKNTNSQIVPFSEDASREFMQRDKRIKRAYFNRGEKIPQELCESSGDNIYLEIYADMYTRRDILTLSRQGLSKYVAGELVKNHSMSTDAVRSLMLEFDPMAVQFPAYPDIVLASLQEGSW